MLNALADHISMMNRKNKIERFKQLFAIQENCKILDIGVANHEYRDSDNLLEKEFPDHPKLFALGIECLDEFSNKYTNIKCVLYDGTNFPFKNKAFDIVWSNAVLEHVGGFTEQVHFVKEMSRIGKNLCFSTPNAMFPVETHTKTPFLHYLPKKYFDKYLCLVNKKWATGNYMNLLTYRKLDRVLQQAGLSNYRIYRNRFFKIFNFDFSVFVFTPKSL